MATATRVVQNPKVESIPTTHLVEKRLVTLLDGKAVGYEVKEKYNFQSAFLQSIPQPDHIQLDLSIEEAKVITIALGHSSNSKAQNIIQAVGCALYPTLGTEVSPAKDAQNDTSASPATMGGTVSGNSYKEPYYR